VVRRAEAGQAVGGKAIALRKNEYGPKWEQSAHKHQALAIVRHSPRAEAQQALDEARLASRCSIDFCDGMRLVRRGTAIFFAHAPKNVKKCAETRSSRCRACTCDARKSARGCALLRAGALVLKSPTRKLTHPARHGRIRLAIRCIRLVVRASGLLFGASEPPLRASVRARPGGRSSPRAPATSPALFGRPRRRLAASSRD
jgi:hypothetical protein